MKTSTSQKSLCLAAIALASAATFVGCNGSNNNIVPNPNPPDLYFTRASSVFVSGADVYVAGNVHWSGDWGAHSDNAVLWKNGVIQYITKSDGGYANSVFVSGDDVYVAGGIETSVAALWKNGVAQRLTLDNHTGYIISYTIPCSVFVSDGDVYAAGVAVAYLNGVWEYISIPMFWKNGAGQLLNDGSIPGYATSIFVSEGDVYVAGYEKGGDGQNEIAVLWKNGSPQYLTDRSSVAAARSVYMSGGDVYVAGIEASVATLWKNGVAQRLTVGDNITSGASSVYVSDGDVYVLEGVTEQNASGQTKKNTVIWKNGSPHQYIGNGLAHAAAPSIFVSGSDVYAVGYVDGDYGSVATLWKNGVSQRLNR